MAEHTLVAGRSNEEEDVQGGETPWAWAVKKQPVVAVEVAVVVVVEVVVEAASAFVGVAEISELLGVEVEEVEAVEVEEVGGEGVLALWKEEVGAN